MTATAAFKSASRQQTRDFAVLARVSVRNPTTLAETNLYLASTVVATPAGLTSGEPAHVWLPLIVDAGSITAPGALGETDVALASCTLRVTKDALNPASFLLDGARVSVWLWSDRFADFDDALCVMNEGRLLQPNGDGDALVLQVRQRTDWNRDIVPVEVTPEAYPQAPEDSLGQRVPVVYGKHRDVPFREPWPEFPQAEDQTAATVFRGVPLVVGGRRAGAAVMVDTGRGGGTVNPKARVLCASHKVGKVSDHLNGAGVYLINEGRLMPIEVVAGDIINTTTEAGLLLPDDTAYAWAAVQPTDIALFAESAENPHAVLDTFHDNNFAKLDWTAGLKFLHAHFPALTEELGEMAELFVMVAYRSPAHTNLTLRLYKEPYIGGHGPTDFALPVSANRLIWMKRWAVGPTWGTGLAGNDVPTRPYAFTQVNMEIGWPNFPSVITGSGTAEVYFCGFVVRFKPRQNVVESERYVTHTLTRPIGPRAGGGSEHPIWEPYTVRETIPAVLELVSRFGANVDGYVDDGEFASVGAFTGGGAATVVERPPDVLAHMLVRYGDESLASIEQGAGAFGSFVGARAKLKTPNQRDMVCALSLGQTTDVMTAISWVTQGGALWLFLDRFTNVWRVIPWTTDRPVDYDWIFRPEDLVEQTSLAWERTPENSIMTGVSLGYGYDGVNRSFQHKVRLAWDGSLSGHAYRSLRDENLTVVASVNDRLDFSTTATFAASLTPAPYDVQGFMQHVTAAMKSANSAQEFGVTNGPIILASFNDQMDFSDTVTNRSITIPPAAYESFEALAAVVGPLISTAVGFTVTCGYSRTTKKFTMDPGVGDLLLFTASGANFRSRRFYATIGFVFSSDTLLTGPGSGSASREEGRFAVTCLTNNLSLLWETGANGLKGTRRNCSSLLGFQTLRDNAETSTRTYLGACPKGIREAALLRTAQRHGARKDTTEDLRAVNDTDTAREVRDRIATLFGKPRVIITFSSDKCLDIERGRVIALSGDFDSVMPYPDSDSNGSWVGKRFIVVETEQMLGPVAFYMKVRAVALD